MFDFPEVLDILNFPQPERGKFQHASNTPKQTGIAGEMFQGTAEDSPKWGKSGSNLLSLEKNVFQCGDDVYNYEDCNGSARC